MDNLTNIFLNTIVFIPIVLIFAIMPYITRKDIMFGISIPSSEWKNEYFSKMRKSYTILVSSVGVLCAIANAICMKVLNATQSIYAMQGLLWGTLVVYFLVFIHYWKKAKKYKAQKNWESESDEIVAVDTSQDATKKSISLYWYVIYIAIIIGTYITGSSLYKIAPDMIVTKYDLQNNPIVTQPKSMDIIWQVITMQIVMAVLFVGINYMINKAKRNIDPSKASKSSMQISIMKYRWSIFLFITGLLVLLIFTQILFSMFIVMPIWLSLGFSLGVIIYAIILSINTGQSGSRINSKSHDVLSDKISRDDDKYWKLGSFYYNKEDPAVFVEKRFGVGWTNNWAKWQSWLIIIAILALILVSVLIW